MSIWRLSLLGRCELRAPSGRPVALPTRKALGLLAYLALRPERRASRERLAALLWPDTDSAQAKLNLRKALSILRKAVGEANGSDLLLITREQVELRADVVACDIDTLEAAARGVTPSPDLPLEELTGEFLQDFTIRDAHEFEAWARLERQRLRETQLALLARRLEAEMSAPETAEAAMQTALRILQFDPFQEGARRALMRLHARQGRPAAAIEQYRELVALLDRELGAQPEDETRVLYRKIAERRRSRPEADTPASATVEAPVATARRRWPRRRLWWLAGCAVVIFGVVAAGLAGWRRLPPEAPTLGPLVTILARQPEMTHPALSPNGELVAHTSRRITPGNSDLYLRALTGGAPIRLTTDPAIDDNAAWSPDGRVLAFTRSQATGGAPCRIIVMTPPNGHERVVGACRVATTSRLAWSADGKAIYFTDKAAPGFPSGLFRLDLETGRSRALTTSPAEIDGDEAPAVSPDGKQIAFLRRSSWTSANVHVLDIARGRTSQLTVDGGRIWSLAWDRTGRGVFFSSNRGGDTGLWWAPARGGGSPKRISAGLLDFRALSAARDQDRLVFEVISDRTDLVQAGDDGVRRPVADTPSPEGRYSDWFATIAADGAMAMVSDRDGGERLWIQAQGQPTAVAAIPGATISEPRWSPDSRRVVFVATRDGASDLYIADRETGRVTALTDDVAADASPVWSEDGTGIYFTSRRGGVWRIWRINASGGGIAPVSAPGPRAVRTDGNDRLLAILDGRPGIWRLRLVDGRETGARTLILEDQQAWDWINWDSRGGGLFHVRRSPDGLGGRIWRRDLASGRDTPLEDTSDLLLLVSFAVRPDGELLLTRRSIETRLMAAEVTSP